MTIDSLISSRVRQDCNTRRLSQEETRDYMRAYHIRQHYGSLHKRQYKNSYYELLDAQKRGE